MNLSPGSMAAVTAPIRHRARIGLVSGGLGAYWPQFPGLLPQLRESAAYVGQRFEETGNDVVDAGFVSDAQDAARAAERLRQADCDLIVLFVATYLTSSMVLPIAQRSGTPVLVVDLQPTEAMDHARTGTGEWLAYCGQCPVPELANVFRRAGIPFRSVSGYLRQEAAWDRITSWVRAAAVRGRLRTARHGLMGHLYPGMLDVSTDLTTVSATFGSHVEVLEFDDLRERVNAVTERETADRVALVREVFELDRSVHLPELEWGARVSVGLDRLVDDFALDSLAYYHRGLAGELHERLGAGMILGASLLTARGVPMAGEYELRTSVAMLAASALGAGGSFTEIQALNFFDNVVEMGHDGPAHLQISARQPLLRGLGVYHGKRGWGVSVEFDVRPGPVTAFGIGQDRDGSYVFVSSEGTVTEGPLLQIGNTTSRVDFGGDPGLWVDLWAATGVGHHWALCLGHRRAELAAAASLLGLEHRHVQL
ncbi:L-fucose/L-arabinose isomerase family protein [Arthrobacter sp. zg-Y820]|uniref:L-fucose/L-arabinose isomerase family protein n=1 Tax=unclassified Arthrobacter TaxID=235627 RepID=UPI001E315A75|nr:MULTISPECIES: L-fucose/L-arabinose isomerase family protein [unclassified Arthrobacter]MCC9195401.1 L-fucose/L-arabinose isomerase family protein [Arthrobacter sp. zg-Y820]MDK1278260.1 L-fucose/L-arabinose isomerase family protein [Arthrobacter sp. zg.Y820]WIB10141.1 L-fucose/L-arabinose isomerase family protein [Arthrobacter sp. zg-Y820]